jgi:hypothetical protein
MGTAAEMKVQFTLAVRAWFYELETILYEKEYFGFPESSHRYADELFRNIRDTLPTRPHRHPPTCFDPDGLGMLYATFRHSRATTWYVFFTRHESADGGKVCIVRHIANNHTVAQYM